MSVPVKQCPICNLDDPEIISENDDYGANSTFKCPRCGRFTFAVLARPVELDTSTSAKISAWLRERAANGGEVPVLTRDRLHSIIKTLPKYNALEKAQKLLRALELSSEWPGKTIALTPAHDMPMAWAENEQEFEFHLESLFARGLIQKPKNLDRNCSRHTYFITPSGWNYLEQHRSHLSGKTQAFVAMSFDNELLPVYTNAIAPAIESAGFRAYRVGMEPHVDRIDAKIMAEIRNSRFLVADVTQQKAGVYYEAGFAHGLGIPVIWSVRCDDLENVHFDTRQYNHIVWATEEELECQLKDFILATIV